MAIDGTCLCGTALVSERLTFLLHYTFSDDNRVAILIEYYLVCTSQTDIYRVAEYDMAVMNDADGEF